MSSGITSRFGIRFVAILACFIVSANAHFQVVMPSNSTIDEQEQSVETIDYKFMHPFEGTYMNMDKPSEVGVFIDGKKEIIKDLTAKKQGDMTWYQTKFSVENPGIYQFYIDPKPYFEPAEDKFIRHITKTIVDAYEVGDGWEKPVGLKAEIVPLSRPYGLYASNIFTAKVLYKGKPATNTMVEVELFNKEGLKAPSPSHITQQVLTNENGEFSFVMPRAGWWGFAALIDDDETIAKDGKNYPIELGAVLWVEVKDYITK